MSKNIKLRIKELNRQLEEVFDPTTFVLNPAAAAIFREIDILRGQCKHSFVNKECEYCGQREDNE